MRNIKTLDPISKMDFVCAHLCIFISHFHTALVTEPRQKYFNVNFTFGSNASKVQRNHHKGMDVMVYQTAIRISEFFVAAVNGRYEWRKCISH